MCEHCLYFLSSSPLPPPGQLSHSRLYEMRSWTSSDLIQTSVLGSVLQKTTAAIIIVDPSLLQAFSSLGPHDTAFSVFLWPHDCFPHSLLLALFMCYAPGFLLQIASLLSPSLLSSPLIPPHAMYPVLFSTFYPWVSIKPMTPKSLSLALLFL